MRKYFWIATLLLWLSGCTHRPSFGNEAAQTRRLSHLLTQSSRTVESAEAKKLAYTAIQYSKTLAKKYEVSTPPLVHNLLVNIGIKKRGLCYQWSDDLYARLQSLHLRTIALYPVGAYIGSYWREHNALVALPKESMDLKRGILLDAWRESGKLYAVPINSDPEYHWQIRKDRCDTYQNGK